MSHPPPPPKRPGRPLTWTKRIQAPPEALALYEYIASLQNSEAFRSCHVYEGADRNEMPLIRWGPSVTSLPYLILNFLGIPNAIKKCETPNCMNPFHYAKPADSIYQMEITPFIPPIPAQDDWNDLIDYYHKECSIFLDFPSMRKAIPLEDISDMQLEEALKNYVPSKSQ